jgi:hypothetical protein
MHPVFKLPWPFGSRHRSSFTKKSCNAGAPEVEVWDDPEWAPALSGLQGWQKGPRYTGKSDPAPLAKLLRSGKPVPEAVAKELGSWLDPPWGKKGPRLVAILPKRYYPGTDSIKSLIAAKGKIEEALKTSGKLEAAVERRTSTFNPDPFLSPREPQRS